MKKRTVIALDTTTSYASWQKARHTITLYLWEVSFAPVWGAAGNAEVFPSRKDAERVVRRYGLARNRREGDVLRYVDAENVGR